MIDDFVDESGKYSVLTSTERLMALHFFARTGNGAALRSLGILNELLPVCDSNGMNLLMWAARGGDEAAIFLAGEVCDGGLVDLWGGNALHHWAESIGQGLGSGAQVLLALGVDPCGKDSWGMMPMHWGRGQAVWAWSMAALWARGEPESWRRCGQLSCSSLAILTDNQKMLVWLREWGSGKYKKMGSDLSESDLDVQRRLLLVVEWSSFIRLRQLNLQAQIDKQNCVARKLGIELA